MTFNLETGAWLDELHGKVGPTGWDMEGELKLATTTDQFYYDDKLKDQDVVERPYARYSRTNDEFVCYDQTSDTSVEPNLWMWVNPDIVCPVPGRQTAADPTTLSQPARGDRPVKGAAETRRAPPVECGMLARQDGSSPGDEPLPSAPSSSSSSSSSSTTTVMHMSCGQQEPTNKDEDSDQPDTTAGTERITKPTEAVPANRPRPPVNYCVLVALALKSSPGWSLNVQQIYTFTREHFPFFQTAPAGWKNTIRHNLCFNKSFHKICKESNRKSCLWCLTAEGETQLRNFMCSLDEDAVRRLNRSMSQPDVIWNLLSDWIQP